MPNTALNLRAFIDIETLPTDNPEVVAELNAKIEMPGNITRQETKDAWEREKRPLALAEAITKTSLDGTYGRVLAVGCALGAGPVEVWIGDEREVLDGFFTRVREVELVHFENAAAEYHAEIAWIGHNVRAFDLRFLYQRAVILGVKPPRSLLEAALSRSWEKIVIDTMLMWNPERDRRIKLMHLCRALGVQCPKADMDGSKVAAVWAAGEVERIIEYSKAEVTALRACYERMVFEHA